MKPRWNAYMLVALATISLLPTTALANKAITTANLLETIRPSEPGNRHAFWVKTVLFNPTGGNATSISKVTLSYFTSTDCTGTGYGTNPGSIPLPSYTTPNGGPSYPISTGTLLGLVPASVWNVGVNKLSILSSDMPNVRSIAVTFRSTNSNLPQTNFSGNSFACVPVTCTTGPSGQCTASGSITTQNFTLKTTYTFGDPADGGVIGCLGGPPLNNLLAARTDNAVPLSPGLQWGFYGSDVTGAQNTSDGAANTAVLVGIAGPGTSYAAGLCQAYTVAGYTGWFLPATNQLTCLYAHKTDIGGFDTTNPYYWTSVNSGSFTADIVEFFGGTVFGLDKSQPYGVRCTRELTT